MERYSEANWIHDHLPDLGGFNSPSRQEEVEAIDRALNYFQVPFMDIYIVKAHRVGDHFGSRWMDRDRAIGRRRWRPSTARSTTSR